MQGVSNNVIRVFLALLSLAVLSVGCKKSGDATATMTVEQASTNMESAFRNASDELKKQADEAAAAVQSQNDASAFTQLDGLNRRSDLTAEQRQAAFAAWMAINARLQETAAGGNGSAQELLEKYRATK
jgi:hypothetical protein